MPADVTIHAAESAAHHAEHGIPLNADVLFQIGPIPVTNSILVMWIVMLGLLIFTRAATGKIAMVPRGLQNFFEFLIESLYDTLEIVLGKHLTRKTFWFFATVFITILACNWIGLLPFFGNFYFNSTVGGEPHYVPLFRAATADLNLPLAIATVYFFVWIYWSLQEVGPVGMLKHIFGSKGGLKPDDFGFPVFVGKTILFIMAIIFVLVGVIEVVSIAFRQVSLPMRLFGNIFAGENLLHAMGQFWGGWFITIPFYGMELLVGFVQALVFMMLTAVFTSLMCSHEEEEAH